ncbi:MAG: OB-fold nucleic acid binding domain-containing protein, partial [Clostridia bacterium]|nr:OB-fold nucleic acid binding domain-containing protein [Clostridia bacterium]
LLKPILDVTYGCIVYQEQVMKICQELAGFTLGQADNIRRAMGKKKMEEMLKWKEAFLHGRAEFTDDHGKFNPAIRGCVATGVSEEIAMKIWNEMETFAEYAFNKSHAAAYALIIYQTSYLKYYYPVETYTAILNDRITKIDKLKHYIASAKAEDISILPPDINLSETYFSTEGNSIRFGLAALKNVGVNVIEDIIAERKANGPYKDLPDFVWRVNGQALNKRCVEALIKSGAFDCFGRPRSHLMAVYEIIIDRATARKKMYANNQRTIWESLNQDDNNCMFIEDTPLIEESEYPHINEYINTVKLQYEHEIAGTYLSGHPLEGFKDVIRSFTFDSSMIPSEDVLDENDEMDSVPTAPLQNVVEDEDELTTEELNGLQNGDSVICGGVITEVKVIQTKSGSRMAFATIEDMYGTFEAVFFNKTFERCKDALQKDVLVCLHGKYTTREGRRPSINVDNLEVLDEEAENLTIKEEVVEVYKPKKLCLKYSIDDGILHDAVKKILSSYNGQDEVYIKDEASGKAFKSSQTVTIRESLIYELETILDKANIVVKE